jgi:hypothetical protein
MPMSPSSTWTGILDRPGSTLVWFLREQSSHRFFFHYITDIMNLVRGIQYRAFQNPEMLLDISFSGPTSSSWNYAPGGDLKHFCKDHADLIMLKTRND